MHRRCLARAMDSSAQRREIASLGIVIVLERYVSFIASHYHRLRLGSRI